MNPEITTKTFSVRFSDCDHHSRLRVSNLFRFMEETVISDAEKNGYGIWKMVKHGYTYAISRIKLRLHHTPLWGEKLNRSEERRVGKECKTRRSACRDKKKI